MHKASLAAVTDYLMEGARNVLGALPLEQQRGRTPGAAIQARIAPYKLCSMLGLWKSNLCALQRWQLDESDL